MNNDTIRRTNAPAANGPATPPPYIPAHDKARPTDNKAKKPENKPEKDQGNQGIGLGAAAVAGIAGGVTSAAINVGVDILNEDDNQIAEAHQGNASQQTFPQEAASPGPVYDQQPEQAYQESYEIDKEELSGTEPTETHIAADNGYHNDTSYGYEASNNASAVNEGSISSAEDIIAANEIDPNDIDASEVVYFDEIGTVSQIDGSAATEALFHFEDGSQYAMFDVDNDGVFDFVGTTEGIPLQELDNNLLVSDAELMINENNNEYLAQNDIENNDISLTGDDYMDDVINI